MLTSWWIVGERSIATRSASGGVGAIATWGGTATPPALSERASFEAASLAGSEEKPLLLLAPLKPELKARPESGPM